MLFPTKKPTGTWRDHSLSIVLGLIITVQLAMVFGFGWLSYKDDQAAHNQPVSAKDFLYDVAGYELPLSIVADTYGVLLIVLLSKWLREVGSNEG